MEVERKLNVVNFLPDKGAEVRKLRDKKEKQAVGQNNAAGNSNIYYTVRYQLYYHPVKNIKHTEQSEP